MAYKFEFYYYYYLFYYKFIDIYWYLSNNVTIATY